VVLVHGGSAHGAWWDHIGPLLARRHHVIAIDLSGHGDSDRRERYDLDVWAHEVTSVAAASSAGPPFVVGHSMGGLVALRAAALFGAGMRGVAIIDSPVRQLTPEDEAARQARAFGPLRIYPTFEQAVRRFHPVPQADGALPFVVEHIARSSLRRVPGGWSWKFDPRIFLRPRIRPAELTELGCDAAVLRCQYGILTAETAALMRTRFGRRTLVAEIPGASHHVLLDQPLALAAGLRILLAAWP
jgi:pimeloyl-ACP methyl ester carboxylesterase